MKKSLIAGAGVAALAMAAFPAMVFADGDDRSITDTLSITVNATCTFNDYDSASPADGSYTATVLNGKQAAFANNNGAHKFGVFCNNNAGWKVTASAPLDLTGTGSNQHRITYQNAAIPAADSGTTEGVWTATVSGSNVYSAEGAGSGIVTTSGVNYIKATTTEPAAAGGGIIAQETASTAGSTFTVTYSAYVGTQTAADTYTATTSHQDGGTIDYTLAAL